MVIAIIAILAAMLLPVLNKARGKARAVTCSNNLKSIGMANIFYANDNNGSDVRLCNTGWGEIWGSNIMFLTHLGIETAEYGRNGTNLTEPYVVPPGRLCPDADSVRDATTRKCTPWIYGKNVTDMGQGGSALGKAWRIDKVKNPSVKIHHIENFSVTKKAGAFYYSDYTLSTASPVSYLTDAGGPHYVHSNRTNILFFDSHVAPKTHQELSAEEASWKGYE